MPSSKTLEQCLEDARNGVPVPVNPFSEKKIRADFVSKVYMILSIQLLVTALIVALCVCQPDVNKHMKQVGMTYFFSGFLLAFVLYLVLICIESARRSFPINLVLLSVLTLAYAIMTGAMSASYEAQEVLMAVGATALATGCVMLLAKYSPWDITSCGTALFVLALVNLLITIVLCIVLPTHASRIVIAGIGSLLICLFLMFDLQLIMGGGKVQLSEEEYVLAAVLLYVDIMDLFRHILILVAYRG